MTFKRPLYGTVRTGPAPSVFPWQVEWVVGKEFRCHIGRVHDDTSLNLDDEFQQSRFSANQQQSIALSPHKMTPRTLNWNVTSMERHAHSAPVRTGSSPIYVKSDRGRIDTPSDTVDEQLGYAVWAENVVRSSSHDTYFILHKVRDDEDTYDQWCVSVVDDVDVTKEDIKLACFKYARGGSASRANLIQLWKSDIMPSAATASDSHSFKISCTSSGDSVSISIEDGAVSNVTCSNSDLPIVKTEDGYYAVVIQVTCEDETYPADVVWDAIKDWDEYTSDTLTSAWVLIGYVQITTVDGAKKFQITQYVKTSLRTERLKYGTGNTSVRYYFNRL